MTNKTRYEEFTKKYQEELYEDVMGYREKMRNKGIFGFKTDVESLIKFSSNVRPNTFIYLYGEDLGKHYWEKYVGTYNRNLINFISYMDDNAQFFLLHEIKTNANLLCH